MSLVIVTQQCWIGIHLVWTILSAICLLLVIVVGYFYYLFYFEPSPTRGDIFARHSVSIGIYFISLKTITSVSFLIIDTSLFTLFSIVFIAINILYMVRLKLETPYFHYWVSKVSLPFL